ATTTFLYDGDDLVAEYDASGNILRRHVFGPGVDEPLVWYQGAGTSDRRWLRADDAGSIIGWSDGAGALIASRGYDPFGQPSGWLGARFGFTGQAMIPEARLFHYKARAYDPALGRFLQTDPVGMAADVNLYAYVGNDPINASDPSGMDLADDIGAILGFNPQNGTDVFGIQIGGYDFGSNNPATTVAGVDVNGTRGGTKGGGFVGGFGGAAIGSGSGAGEGATTVAGVLVVAKARTSFAPAGNNLTYLVSSISPTSVSSPEGACFRAADECIQFVTPQRDILKECLRAEKICSALLPSTRESNVTYILRLEGGGYFLLSGGGVLYFPPSSRAPISPEPHW
ncbi:MAG: RHS repeat-associated core domain-containing protein, partial [Caulobacteraceae bacterium]|nr:RHS repeat-associated core domain-containing protein [Caulobacteraceae bacterium]